MKTGFVYQWPDYPVQRTSQRRTAHWFICMGSTPLLAEPKYFYALTTTTQIQHYEPGRERENRTVHKFSAGAIFTWDCLIDFTDREYSISESTFLKHEASILIKGSLQKEEMLSIYQKLTEQKKVSRQILSDIKLRIEKDIL